MSPVLYEELIFTWKRKITNATFEYSIHYEMILNFYETPRDFTTPNKATFAEKGAQSVPIVYVDDKREITDTFCVNISGEFLPIQLIYSSCYRLCQEDDFFLPWAITQRLGTGENAKTLLIFDVFKGQTTSALNKLLQKNDIIVIHVPNSLSNLFQPLDILLNKSVKCYFSSKNQDR